MTAPKAKTAPYNVGYGKPPRHTQFRKGRSGNPRGRPPRAAGRLKALTLQEAYRPVVMTEAGRSVPVTAMQAILRSQVELAAKGNVQAQRAIPRPAASSITPTAGCSMPAATTPPSWKHTASSPA